MNLKMIGRLQGQLIALEAACLIPAVCISLVYREWNAAGSMGISMGIMLALAGLLWLLCRVGFGGQQGMQEYVPVELTWQGKTLRLLALRDTGNTLRDPLTGESVLICGADVGEQLLGLPRTAFLDPTGTLAAGILPGARLIPYRSVGQPAGLLLALRMKDVKVGAQIISPLVAFAPQEIGGSCYQMLTGGMGCFG